jgi:hypothetical protein
MTDYYITLHPKKAHKLTPVKKQVKKQQRTMKRRDAEAQRNSSMQGYTGAETHVSPALILCKPCLNDTLRSLNSWFFIRKIRMFLIGGNLWGKKTNK